MPCRTNKQGLSMKKRIAANPGRCIGCRTCEIACALAHSELRIEDMTASDFKARVAILKYEDISTPVACRQCEDAPCAAACPCGAIVVNSESVTVLRHKCIGCKACIMAGPYWRKSATCAPACPKAPPACGPAPPTCSLWWRMKRCSPQELSHFNDKFLGRMPESCCGAAPHVCRSSGVPAAV